MGQKFFEDSIGTLTHSSGTLVLSASRITLGGQQETFTSLSYTISGLSANTKYNVFVVKSGITVALVASTNSITVGPTGYTMFKFIRSFMTRPASATFASFTAAISDPNPVGTIIQSMLTLAQFQSLYGTTWVLADGASASGTMFNLITGNANLPDARGIFLRGAGTNASLTDASGAAYSGGSAGNTQNDQMQGHKHNDSGHQHVTTNTNQSGTAGGIYTSGTNVSTPQNAAYNTQDGQANLGNPTQSTNGIPRSGNETRPANLAVNVFIKVNME